MQGNRWGMLSLRFDSLYCVTLGSLIAAYSGHLSPLLSIPQVALVLLGVVVVAWAALVELMRWKLDLRVALRIVMIVNIVATLGVALVSLTAAAFLTAVIVIAVAIDVALFAGSQAWALLKLKNAQNNTTACAG